VRILEGESLLRSGEKPATTESFHGGEVIFEALAGKSETQEGESLGGRGKTSWG